MKNCGIDRMDRKLFERNDVKDSGYVSVQFFPVEVKIC